MHTIDDIIARCRHASKLLLLQDFRRMEDRKSRKGAYRPFTAAPVGKENLYVRGNILMFMTGEQFAFHALSPESLTQGAGHVPIFSDHFIPYLSERLDKRSDRARIIMRDRNGIPRLAADAIIRNYTQQPLKDIRQRIPGLESDEDFSEFLSAEQAGELIDDERFYSALLGEAFTGAESMRVTTTLCMAMALGTPTICTKQRVSPQEGYDSEPVTMVDSISGKTRTYQYSRLGTGDILQFGIEGLETRIRLRIAPDARRAYHVGEVFSDETKRERLPVVFEVQDYRFDETRGRVVPDSDPYLIPAADLPLYELKD